MEAWHRSRGKGIIFFKAHRKVIVAGGFHACDDHPDPARSRRANPERKRARLFCRSSRTSSPRRWERSLISAVGEAAKRIAIHEIDTILVGEKARDFKVDGHLVVNPVGFSGRRSRCRWNLRSPGARSSRSSSSFLTRRKTSFLPRRRRRA